MDPFWISTQAQNPYIRNLTSHKQNPREILGKRWKEPAWEGKKVLGSTAVPCWHSHCKDVPKSKPSPSHSCFSFAQRPKIPLAGKVGPFLMEFLVHRNIPYSNDHCRKPPPHLPWKQAPRKFHAVIQTLIFWVYFGPSTTKFPGSGCS